MWTILNVVLGPFLPSDVVRAGAMSATVPLWFLAVYLTLTAAAPLTHAWWRRLGPITIAILAAGLPDTVGQFYRFSLAASLLHGGRA